MDKIKLLLVDDEEDFVKTLSERIKMRKIGSNIALSGEDALEMVESQIPDVVVLDIRMPGIDGLEVLKNIKKHYPNIQVIILTGNGTEKEMEQAKRLGAYEVLTKPTDIDTIVDRIKKAYEKVQRMIMAATFAEAGESETAKEYLQNNKEPKKENEK